MSVIIRDDYEGMCKYAARLIADFVKEKPDAVLGLATGSTPIGVYKELIRIYKEEKFSFAQVKAFTLYEFLGEGFDIIKPYGLDRSCARYMHEELFKHIDINKKNIYVFDGFTKKPYEVCARYEKLIKDAGGIDLQVLGIGRDGHWGYNEPGSSLGSRTRIVALAKQTTDDNYEYFYRKVGISREEMPHFALTMGVGTILESKEILLLASGTKKAEIVAKALEGPVTAQVTASAIQIFPGRFTVCLDMDAARELKSIEHILHVEKVNNKYGIKSE